MAERGHREGQPLGNYQLLQLLGQGRWASVYLGEHRHLHTQAAIKVLHDPLGAAEVEGFLTEARTLARLRHPHIVRILDFGVQEDTPFLVMDYAPGGTLRQLHPKGTRLPLSTVVSYVKQVASALQYAHEQRLIHRDLKPENLLLGPDQQIWLSDFGLALVAPSARSQPLQQTAGTLAYMAPEQLKGHPTAASDQYALGVLVYEWLCGERPFSGALAELAVKQALAPPPALTEKVPTLPARVEQVVWQALAKDPQLRFGSVQAFAQALEAAWRGDSSGQTLPILVSADVAQVGPVVVSRRDLPTGTVTLLFTDMEGSTSLLQQLGERYTQVLSQCRHLLRAAFHQYQGHEVDMQGDSFFVAFARATDALSAAVDAQRGLAAHVWPHGVSVRVRMGLHTGEPMLSTEGYVGLDVHRAARIMSAGHRGQVLLSQTTRDLVEHDLPTGVSLRDLGTHRLKDFEQKSHLFQLVIAGLPADFPPLKTLDTHPHNLPVQLTALIGREQEIVAVCRLLHRPEVRLLTLTGTGGIGKTRLGVHIAANMLNTFADGVCFVSLASIRDPDLVLPTIAYTLGLREAGDWPLLERLHAHLRDKQMLLLLDNFEPVVTAAPELVELLAVCPQLKVLVTSRAVLRVRGEYEFPVDPLALPDRAHAPEESAALSEYAAIALFVQRAQALKPDFELTAANASVIAAICLRLDGLPLAIELAVARLKLLPPPALLARLQHRLDVLTHAPQDLPTRQQTLRKTLAWSYDLLPAQEQQLFRRLSVFVGGCTLEAAESVDAAFGERADATAFSVLDGIASLIDKSLLYRKCPKEQEPRFMLLETIREYGQECLRTSGEVTLAQRAHAAYYLALVRTAEPKLTDVEQGSWLERLEHEHENLRMALQWLEGHNEIEAASWLAGALWRFWWFRGYFNEGRTVLERLLRTAEGVAVSVRAKALHAAGFLAIFQDDAERAEELCTESLNLFRALGDAQGMVTSLGTLGFVALKKSDHRVARVRLEGSLALGRSTQDTLAITFSLGALSRVAAEQGEYREARRLAEESLHLSRETGDTWGIAWALLHFSWILALQGDYVEASPLLEECLVLCRTLGYKLGIAHALLFSGFVLFFQGQYTSARPLIEEGLALHTETGDRRGVALGLCGLGRLALSQGNPVTARTLFEESLALCRKINHLWLISSCLEGLAMGVFMQGDPAWAARLWGRAESIGTAIGASSPAIVHALDKQAMAAARLQLGEKTFTTLWAQGRTMTLEQALDAQEQATVLTSSPLEQPLSSSVKQSVTYPDGLTTREVEVLRLVAQGLTNAQIAEALVVSLLTAKAHLRSIYSKLGVTSRSAATRYALEHHLS